MILYIHLVVIVKELKKNTKCMISIDNDLKLTTPLYYILTLSNMAQGIFTLAYMSHDHLHGSHAGLPMIERADIA